MRARHSAIRRTVLLVALALALTLVALVPPAYAGLGTSPTIWLSSSAISWGDNIPITMIAGLGTSPTLDSDGKLVSITEPNPGAAFEIYANELLLGTGTTGEDGLFQTNLDLSRLLPGGYMIIIKFPCPPICGESKDIVNKAETPLTVVGVYNFVGFMSPVTGELNTVKSGQTVPIKWQITGVGRTPLGNLDWIKSITTVPLASCGGESENLITEADTSGLSGLRYDADAGQYIFTLQTDRTWAGTCRQLVLTLVDGETYMADFQFK